MAESASERNDTFPKLLIRNARERPQRAAMREKDLGIWQTWTWSQVLDEVEALAGGLKSLGLERDDKVAIVGNNRPQLYWGFAAPQAMGAVPVPVYQDSVADEMQYVLDHGDVRFAFVEDQEQVDKILSVKDQLPKLEAVIYEDPRGLHNYDEPFLYSLEAVQDQGRAYARSHEGFFREEAAKGRGGDLSVIVYTSGTTGRPKGVMLSYDNLLKSAEHAVKFDGLTENDETLAYLPMAWVGDHFLTYCQGFLAGFCLNCPESPDTVMTDLREIGPSYFFAPPRTWENLITNVMVRMEDASRIKQRIFHYYLRLARRVGVDILEGKPVSTADRINYAIGNLLVYGPLRNVLGFSRIRVAYTAGEAIGPDIFDFFRSIGVNLKQLYGQTECSVYLCLQTDDDVRPDTVGPPGEGVEIRLDDNGEVLYRSPGVFMGYYKNDEETQKTKTPEGWVHSGDAGLFTEDGHLRIIDRAKDVGRLNDGTMFSPKFVENKLKFHPHIMEAVAFGHERESVMAFINIDFEALSNWAERENITFTGYVDLAGRPEVYDLIRQEVEAVNRDLASDPELAPIQITRFVILHKELDPDDGEITRTRKVRRRIINERYGELIEALYRGDESVQFEVPVTYEDGSTGVLGATLRISDATTYQPMSKAG
ncbi:AMP-binding protein [Aquisalimonas lutea]|uniref:AMP-binding protein n=1 Tax=Aquisalimonas lutea TaxID=1327750 RepID=UPI0025B4DDC1|nr:AMP-binding protein [Aquisalimonas lutea]MDN3518773.1 AMP-binding protein [Aquisalimonas lutea]